ncbi:MAG: DNA primase [Oscillospiraceae bacterium]|nr:DNA primase [Oscillospiraceae bacterium]
MALPDDFLLQLKQNNPIESVMGSYVQMKRSGRDYVCLCPFHSEKTPSCHVNIADQYFYCFGCHAGGDVITFVMKQENLEYMEAVRFLAQRAGMSMPEDSQNTDSSKLKRRILEMNRLAARFYNNLLMKEKAGEKGRLYFRSRELSVKAIVKYGLGYAPDDWTPLTSYLKGEGYTENEIVAANLARTGRNGGIYDSFRDRVIFPIIDLRGNVVAFGGRIIDGEEPKYLNSSDTPVFKKSRNLFSMNFAKRSDERRLILAEGYMDVIAVNQAGFENVVATLGTALTSEQARLMAQYADEVIISYDSDNAGQNATHRAIDLLSQAGVRTRIIKMEGAKDPDEYIKKFGALRFKQLLDNSDGAINFELAKCAEGLDITADTGRVEYLKRCANVIAGISSSIERDIYISRLAKEQDISKDAISEQVNRQIKRTSRNSYSKEWNDIRTFSSAVKEDPEAVRHPKEYRAERGIIAYLALHPDDLEYIKGELLPDMFVSEFDRRVFVKLTEGMEKSPNFGIMSLQGEFSADEMGKITSILSSTKDIELNRRAADDFIEVLKSYYNKSRETLSPSEMSDEQFRQLANAMKNKKG